MVGNLKNWEPNGLEMQKGKRAADLVSRNGEPHHKVQEAGFEIWHYPLGVVSRMLYSVHVTVHPDQSCQAFMFMEPTNLPDSPAQRPDLGQSVRRGVRNALNFLRTLLGR